MSKSIDSMIKVQEGLSKELQGKEVQIKISGLKDKILTLRIKNREIKKYTQHKVTCSVFYNENEKCNCGLNELLI